MSLQIKFRKLFVAVFHDGSEIHQTEEDKSLFYEGRSAFTDVVKSEKRLIAFALRGIEDSSFIGVNLIDGSFNINGQIFEAMPSSKILPLGGTFKIIYFRDTEVTLKADGTGTHSHRYRIGWEYSVNDETYVQTIVVD